MTGRLVALIWIASAVQAQPAGREMELAEFFAKVHGAMGLKPGAVVADVGSGDSPDHPARISRAIQPAGKLVCEDIDGPALRKLAASLKADSVENVQFVVGDAGDPRLPARTFDAILVSNAYHEFTDPGSMSRHLREALKPGGKLVVLEAISPKSSGKSREEQAKVHELEPEALKRELGAAGFRRLEMVVLREAEGMTRYLVSAQPE